MTQPTPLASEAVTSGAQGHPEGVVDPRAPRFAAGITAVLLLAGVLLALLGSSASGALALTTVAQRAIEPAFVLLTIVALLFVWSLASPRTQPWAVVFRVLVRPRLGPPSEWEDARPPRFAQGVGLVVVGVGLLLHLAAVPLVLVIAAAAAFAAAALNAVIGYCLGCEIYLLLIRIGLIRQTA